ncbi:MAG: NADH:flavin oxidoreductase, partial [Candidatus Thorarchaeota archaeon]
EILAGRKLSGRVLVYDDEQYYLASALAQKLRDDGSQVTFVTPAPVVSPWSEYTLEQVKIQQALMSRGVDIACNKVLTAIDGGTATLKCVYLGTESTVEADALVPVTSRLPNDALYTELLALKEQFADHGIKSVDQIGDCHAPGTIAMAVYAGHQYARQLDNPVDQMSDFKRENYFRQP